MTAEAKDDASPSALVASPDESRRAGLLRPGGRASGLETAILFALAFGCRALWPDAAFFGTDQVGTLIGGRAVLAGDILVPGPEVGWSAFFLGPLLNQVAGIGLVARDEFADFLVLLALLNAAAVVGFRQVFGRLVSWDLARLAAFVLAVHPTSVAIGGTPGASSLVLPTTCLFVGGAVLWAGEREPKGFAAAAIGAALMIQAHVTTLLLLPLVAIGIRRRAPIGYVGRRGLAIASIIAAPMVVGNVLIAFESPEGVRHAGGGGAPYFVALVRAIGLEATAGRLNLSAGEGVMYALVAAGMVFSALVVGGVARVLRRGEPLARLVVGLGFFVPTVVVPLLPRGALYYYFESSVAFRCLAAAVAIGWLAERARSSAPPMRLPWSMGFATASLAVAVGVGGTLVVRARAGAEGVIALPMGYVDLRNPLGGAPLVVGIPTLGAQRDIGRALGELGVDRATLLAGLRGPWRWMLADSAWAFSRLHAGASTPPPSARPDSDVSSLMVLHQRDALVPPACASRRAGQFRVYRFDDLCVRPSGTSDQQACSIPGGRDHVAIAATSLPGAAPTGGRLDATPVRLVPESSPSGLAVWLAQTTRADAPRAFELRWRATTDRSPMVRMGAEVVAFEVCTTSRRVAARAP